MVNDALSHISKEKKKTEQKYGRILFTIKFKSILIRRLFNTYELDFFTFMKKFDEYNSSQFSLFVKCL